MLRMAHRIATTDIGDIEPIVSRNDKEWMLAQKQRCVAAQSAVESAITVVVDNVSDFYCESDRMEWDFAEHFPTPLPFHHMLLVEFNMPQKVLNFGRWLPVHRATHAALIRTKPIEDAGSFLGINHEFLHPKAKWISRLSLFTFGFGKFFFSEVSPIWQFDETGNLCQPPNAPCTPEGMDNPTFREYANSMIAGELAQVPLLAMCFANCKNVTRTVAGKECEPDAPWVRKHNPPAIKYHVLNINPMKEVLRTEGGSETNGIQKALHICRGHFARYDNGMFGRSEPVTVWKPSHVRGNSSNGVVVKDYSIGKPR